MGDDGELETIRAARMAQLQGQGQGQGNAGKNEDQEKQEQERREKAEQMKNQMLSQILDQQARARLNTIMIAKPEKAQMIEGILINMARSGQLREKLGESQLIGLLEQVSEKTKQSTKVKFDRRRSNLDDDDEEYLDL